MDISGPVRRVLQQYMARGGGAARAGTVAEEVNPLRLLVRAVGNPEEEIAGLPRFLAADAPLLAGGAPGKGPVAGEGGGKGGRPIHGWLALASALRVLPRVRRGDRALWREALKRQLGPVVMAAQHLLASRSTPAVAFLWHYYLLMLGRHRAGAEAPDLLMTGLWRRGIGGQAAAGHLHPLTPETVVETFTYEELGALHAAYNAVAMPGGEELVMPVERLVKWHVENTQPDHGTQEPWGLAAFAALDETGTFAPQQIHDARVRVERGEEAVVGGGGELGVIVALLADAVITQEEGAG